MSNPVIKSADMYNVNTKSKAKRMTAFFWIIKYDKCVPS